MKVDFYDTAEDSLLKFAVIAAKHNGKNVFCKHKERSTLEIPGGHREQGESIEDTAKRELYEETGAVKFEISPVCVYAVEDDNGAETCGMLYYAEIEAFEPELHNEIEKIVITDKLPESWTYPLIQPFLLERAEKFKRGSVYE